MVVKNIYIIQPPPHIKWDTTIVVGQTVALSGYLGADYSYQWTPLTANLSCTNCANPVSTTTNNATYSVMITDYLHCDTVTNIYKIIVEPKTSVDVPTAFTPNGDGVNDVVYVNGWGIKKLNYFRIYNRWGQLLFETNDINEGWNGIFNGVPQNMETYVYQVSADTYLDKEPVLKSGTIKLIR